MLFGELVLSVDHVFIFQFKGISNHNRCLMNLVSFDIIWSTCVWGGIGILVLQQAGWCVKREGLRGIFIRHDCDGDSIFIYFNVMRFSSSWSKKSFSFVEDFFFCVYILKNIQSIPPRTQNSILKTTKLNLNKITRSIMELHYHLFQVLVYQAVSLQI